MARKQREGRTSIIVTVTARDSLRAAKRGQESYSGIILRLLSIAEGRA